jgi:3,4-dihydroxy 2-butanone 4-phosphate synthase / GTP cyclohydrolase II
MHPVMPTKHDEGACDAAPTAQSWQVAVEEAVAELRKGHLIVVIDDVDRENEADLVVAAEDVQTEQLAFMIRHTSGIICVPMQGDRLDRLGIGPMVTENTEPFRTAFAISVDHTSASTGVSAADRGATARALASSAAQAANFTRPGHMFPLRAREGGVLQRAGHTEAAVDLMRLADKQPAAVICELINDDGTMSQGPHVLDFAVEHGLRVVTVADLIRYRRAREKLVVRTGSATLPTSRGEFRAVAYRSILEETEHLALVMGDASGAAPGGVLVRVHSECLTGDLMGSQRCDCGAQLTGALDAICAEGRGVLVYLRGHEGRGIGLGHKLRAYALQEQGKDTVDANLALGLPVDSREYGIGAQILADLGVTTIRLITNNPAKYGGLEGYDIEILGRYPLPTAITPQNIDYLKTKRDRLGHEIDISSPKGG